MAIRTTFVTSLPRLARNVDWTEVGGLDRPWSATPGAATVCRTTVVRVDLQQLAADLEAEARRIFGPSAPPRYCAR